MKVNILGTEYEIKHSDYKDIPEFEKRGICAYCDSTLKEIVQCNIKTYPGFEDETDEYIKLNERETLRHEIVHAFLSESGLADSSCRLEKGWAKNEEMVDWIALQFPKMLKAFQEVNCL